METACVEFLHRGTVRLWFAAGGEFSFAGCSSQKLVLGRHCVGTSALSGRAGWGAWLGTGRRRPSRTQSCFPTKENMLGVGFGCRRPPAKQQGPRSQRQPSPASPYAERRAGGENGLRCFPERRRVRAVVCCPRRVSLCRMQLQEARFGLPLRQDLGAERPSWLRGHGGGVAQKAFAHPILLPRHGEHVGNGFRAPETPSKAAGPREPGAAPPRFALWRADSGGENGLRCFPEPRRVGAVVICPRRLSLCTRQLPEARFGPSVRRGLGAERPNCSGGMAGAWA